MAPVSGPGVPTPLVDRGEASAVDNSQKAAMAKPKKRKKKKKLPLMRIGGLALAHTAFISGGSFCFRFIFSGSSIFFFFWAFFLPGYFFLFFLTSMRKDAN